MRAAAPWLGLATLAVFVAAALFPAHRLLVRLPARLRPRFRAASWLRAHRVLGTLAFALALVHVGLRFPQGGTGTALVALLALSLLSVGLVEALTKRVPRLLTERLRVSEPAALVGIRVTQLAREAETLADGWPPAARAAFDQRVAPLLRAPGARLGPPFPEEAAGPVAVVEAAWPALDEAGREGLEDLRAVLFEKLELDAQRGLEGALALARLVHALVTGALIGLAAVHGAGFWLY